MKAFLIVTTWAVLAVSVCFLLFAPERGLMHVGPMATAGLGMLGGGLYLRSRCTADPDRTEAV